MEFSFDPGKRARTLAECGVDFADAQQVFDGRSFTFEDVRFAYPEPRFSTIGLLAGRMVVVIWTATDTGRRIISMRKANEREQDQYRHRLD